MLAAMDVDTMEREQAILPPEPYPVDSGLIDFAEKLNTVSFSYMVDRSERMKSFDAFRAALSKALKADNLEILGGSPMTIQRMLDIANKWKSN